MMTISSPTGAAGVERPRESGRGRGGASVVLEAAKLPRTHRRYRIDLAQDLFGTWTVSIAFGRAGTSGQRWAAAAADLAEARQIARQKLRRRTSAERRIGQAYQVVALDDPDALFGTNEAIPTLAELIACLGH